MPAGAAVRCPGAGHHHQQLGVAGTGDEHLVAVDHVGIAVAARPGAQRGGIGAGVGLGETVGAELLTGEHRRQPGLANGLVGVAGENPVDHVVDGQKGGGGGAALGQLLDDQGRIEAAQAQPAGGFRGVETAEAKVSGLAQDIHRKNAVGVPFGGVGRQFALSELACRIPVGLLVGVEFEVHERSTLLVWEKPLFWKSLSSGNPSSREDARA